MSRAILLLAPYAPMAWTVKSFIFYLLLYSKKLHGICSYFVIYPYKELTPLSLVDRCRHKILTANTDFTPSLCTSFIMFEDLLPHGSSQP
jgi:hypothetical protein